MNIPYLDLGKINASMLPEIEEAALRVVHSGYYLNSPEVTSFEQRWADYNGTTHCVSTANGLDALTAILCAMKALYHWSDNSEVIVSAHTFIASFQAITKAGLVPVPCDVDANTYLIDTNLIEPLITKNTVAIMPVHLYGRICNMMEINRIAHAHNLRIVADACQAHGMCAPNDLGEAAAFSFYPGKNLGALGDGGCLVTNNSDIAAYARAYCNYGASEKYHHQIKGINSRLDSIQAAILNVKLNHLNKQNKLRQTLAYYYNHQISNPLITLPNTGSNLSNWHIYPIFCEQRNRLQQYLSDHGISTLVHYPIPPHKQPAYTELNHLTIPVTEHLCHCELSIPLNPTITLAQQECIIEAINSFR